jgi:peptide/nickel transport system substrate-binding protein
MTILKKNATFDLRRILGPSSKMHRSWLRCEMKSNPKTLGETATAALVLGTILAVGFVLPAAAQDTPRRGGVLNFAVHSDPSSYDGHREESSAVMHNLAPFYNLLVRADPDDTNKIIPDIAESWTSSNDGLTFTFKIRQGVKFHDGSPLTSADVKATYEKIIFPPKGVVSRYKGIYSAIKAIEAPDPSTVIYRLSKPSGAFINIMANPWSWIYKADIITKDPTWYEKNILGTGPFILVEHVSGSHVEGKRNPDYWDKGRPYLDGFRTTIIKSTSARVAAVRSGRVDIEFRGFTPQQRDAVMGTLGDKGVVQQSVMDCALWVAANHDKKPLDDKRVRRALTLALDRWEGSKVLSKITLVKDVVGMFPPGTTFATPTEELVKYAGMSRDAEASRKEARRLLKEAGAEGLKLNFHNRGIPMPYEAMGIWLIDQWRKIGVDVTQHWIEPASYFKIVRRGDHELAIDFNCPFITEPEVTLQKFLSVDKSPSNYSRYTDPVLDELFEKQSRATDLNERKKYVQQFEKRVMDEEARSLITHLWRRIIPHWSKVRGWKPSPSLYTNQSHDRVWLSE